jgi:glycosyltransferase involved in cell wall biosynthesis
MRTVLFLVTEDWYFWSHRLPLAREAQRNGYSVIVATRVQEHGDRIVGEGFKLIPISMLRRSKNPLKELISLLELISIYRSERPDIVHHVAVKPVVYGSIAARFARVPRVINAIAGMGYVFSSKSIKAQVLRPFIKRMLKMLLNRSNTRTIFQNPDDQNMLIQAGIIHNELTRLIRGSGVDQKIYYSVPEPAGTVTIVFASRMLWDKGVKEFVDAAQLLKADKVSTRFVLVGDTDEGNLAAVPSAQLAAWHKSGVVEWWGRRSNMPEIFAQSHIVCLPSAYGEGIPKVLIEAASCGRPIVTTDAPGCREIVQHNENGLLVPLRDHVALAQALRQLIDDPALRVRMGARGRTLVMEKFTVEKVVGETLSLYQVMFS